jgi:hypothetical protein
MMTTKRNDLVIDCAACPKRVDDAECDDCLVSFILDHSAEAVVFDVAEERALRALSAGGLLPAARFKRHTG